MDYEPTTLFDAINLLARVHTGDDERVGFVLITGAQPWEFSDYSRENYMRAWKIVREQMHMPTRPIEEDAKK